MTAARTIIMAGLATLLGACAASPPQSAPAAPVFDMAAAAAIPAAQLADFEAGLRTDLKSVSDQAGKPWLQFAARNDGEPAWSLGEEGFRGDSGELEAAAMSPLGALAQRVSQACPCVVHVIGERVGDGSLPSEDIGERRAAAVAAVLGRLGVAPGRVRYESRLLTGRAGGVVVVVVPVVEGSEPKAWMPPAISGEAS